VIEERVQQVLARVFELPAGSVDASASQDTMERWDSIGHMNLCLALEEEFGVSFDDRQVTSMTSVPAIVQVVSSLRAR
jgi:acyl carrier protein